MEGPASGALAAVLREIDAIAMAQIVKGTARLLVQAGVAKPSPAIG